MSQRCALMTVGPTPRRAAGQCRAKRGLRPVPIQDVVHLICGPHRRFLRESYTVARRALNRFNP